MINFVNIASVKTFLCLKISSVPLVNQRTYVFFVFVFPNTVISSHATFLNVYYKLSSLFAVTYDAQMLLLRTLECSI